MKSAFIFVIAIALLPAQAAVAAATTPVNEMSQAAIQSAFQVLRRDYIRREDLTFTEINRAALEGLLARLNFGAEFVRQSKDVAAPAARLISDTLTPSIGYLRPTTCQLAEVVMMESKLKEFAQAGLSHLILDLRSPAIPGEFEVSAAMLELFVPEGRVLFKLRQMGNEQAQLFLSKRVPLWTSSLIVLTDADTNNVAEVVAAVLRDQRRALLIGSPTRGATVRYETVPVDEGWLLRFASAEMLLPDDDSVFRKGLTPDLRVLLESKKKLAIFSQIAVGPVKQSAIEKQRPRFNESALVHGNNPELDDYVRRSNGQSITGDDQTPRDLVLQRAMDMLSSQDHLEATTLRWKTLPAGNNDKAEVKRAEPAKK